MTNEWNEFLDYTANPVYSVRDKKDMSFLGRFTMDMIRQNIGFGRIFTIVADICFIFLAAVPGTVSHTRASTLPAGRSAPGAVCRKEKLPPPRWSGS